ncbi:MAG: molybdate transporter substrate-binding protein [Hyphomicrobiales bacterium]|nr:molybdate transporter substrate-binding protein [Hyphomicrobiales bacterium]
MTALRILSGGAAHGLVKALEPQFRAQTGASIEGDFGAVGMMVDKLRAGAPADLLILTAKAIAELERERLVVPGTSADLGAVQTALAIRDGDATPHVETAEGLKATLLSADEIYYPDSQQATAGIHFARMLDAMGVADAVAGRLRPYPNGATAMRAMAASTGARPLGCTQATEIVQVQGVTLIGPLPAPYDLATVYTAGVCADAAAPDLARALVALLSGADAREQRARAGFD